MIDDAQLNAMLEQAAERGATRALERIGLHDDDAGKDVRDLRTLLESWRTAKGTVLRTIFQWMTALVLSALALGAWQQIDGKR